MINIDKFKLVIISGNRAVFTSKSLETVGGDGWRNTVYDDCICDPYDPYVWYLSLEKDEEGSDFTDNGEPHWSTFSVYFYSILETPKYHDHKTVYDLIKKEAPWLRSPEWHEEPIAIFAGVTLKEFYDKIIRSGGMVFVPGSYEEVAGYTHKDNDDELRRLREKFLKEKER